MEIVKKVLDEIYRCYCAGSVTVDGNLHVLLASEEIEGPCYAYYGENFSEKKVVWEKSGGTMSLVEIPGTNGEFLAVQNFFPGFNAQTSKIVWGKYVNGEWVVKDFINLPYVHRFDILQVGDKKYILCCTLCDSKSDRNDWSAPGRLWVGELPNDFTNSVELRSIKSGLLKNHGYSRGIYKGKEAAFTTCDSGIYVAIPPQSPEEDWTVEHIMEGPISDVAVYDVDGDGEDEIITIAPFHGNEFKVMKKVQDEYQEVYAYPNEMDFAHAVWAGDIRGRATIIGGIRRMDCELFYVQYNKSTGEYETTMIEEGVGTANVSIVHEAKRDIIIAANHTKNEAALYIITD